MLVLSFESSLQTTHHASAAAVWIQNQRHLVSDQDTYPMETHLARKVREHLGAIFKLNTKECVRQSFDHLTGDLA